MFNQLISLKTIRKLCFNYNFETWLGNCCVWNTFSFFSCRTNKVPVQTLYHQNTVPLKSQIICSMNMYITVIIIEYCIRSRNILPFMISLKIVNFHTTFNLRRKHTHYGAFTIPLISEFVIMPMLVCFYKELMTSITPVPFEMIDINYNYIKTQ